jgi:hypothetical protein
MDLANILKAVVIPHTNTNHEHEHGIYPTRTRLFSNILITARQTSPCHRLFEVELS